jgi:hypothetical protein
MNSRRRMWPSRALIYSVASFWRQRPHIWGVAWTLERRRSQANDQSLRVIDVRFGPLADLDVRDCGVSFTPNRDVDRSSSFLLLLPEREKL